MQSFTLLSLLLLSIIALSPFAPAFAFRPLIVAEDAPAPLAAESEFFPVLSSTAPVPSRPSSSSVQPSSHSSSSTSAPHTVVSSSTSVSPSQPAYPLNLPRPFSPAPSTWSIRYLAGTYYYVNNNTLSEVTVSTKTWKARDVDANLQRLVGDDQWQAQQKQLARHVRRVNAQYSNVAENECVSGSSNHSSCIGGDSDRHHDEHDKHHNRHNSLMGFYLRHAQCGACVQKNAELLKVSDDANSQLPYLASYQPAAMMKWCTLATPKLSSERPPVVSSAPLADWEGVCIPAEAQCPSATIDMNILSPTTCAADEPVTKQSCTLCVLDGYQWETSSRAFDRADNYAGQCVNPATAPTHPTSSSNSKYHYRVSVTELDSCPSAVASMQTARQFNAMAMSFGTFVFVTGLMLCCLCMRACCMARKTRQLAVLRLANVQAVAEQSVHVPIVASAPTPSAPPAAGYPAAVAAQQFHEPLLSSGLNPPRMSVSAAYPQLQAQRVAVAQPYAYGRL